VVIDNSGNIDVAGIVDGTNFKINGAQGSDGQVLTSTGSGVAWEDAAGGSALDDITAGDAASTLATTAGNITIDAQGSDTDIIFKGTDDSSDITALTLDMSDAGKAIFNSAVVSANNTDTQSIFGRTALGFVTGLSDYAYLGHLDVADSGGYALVQSAAGATFLNAEDGQDLSFSIHGTRKMVLDSAGSLGIGTTSPMTLLHVFEGDGSYPDDANNHLVVESDSHSYIGIGGGTTSDCGIHFGDSGAIDRGRVAYSNNNDAMSFNTAATERATINSTGGVTMKSSHQGDTIGNLLVTSQVPNSPNASENCQISVKNGGQMIQIMAWAGLGARVGTRTSGWDSNSGGNCYLTGQDSTCLVLKSDGVAYLANGSTAVTSDERLKKNITDMADGQLAKINALKVRHFEWKDGRKAGTQTGVIAQEVETVEAALVTETEIAPDPDDTSRDFDGDVKIVKYGDINMRLLKAVQELSAKLDAAEARIKTLEDA